MLYFIAMTINTILFDLDGTLVDTAPDLTYALNQVLIENDKKELSLKYVRNYVSKGGKALIKLAFDDKYDSDSFIKKHQRLLEIYQKNISNKSKVFKGIDRLLAKIKQKNMCWGIVTNKPEYLTKPILYNLNLKPDIIVCGDTLRYNKPHPEPLFYVCEKLNVKPYQCIFLGDDEIDVITGKAAGVKTVIVSYGYGKNINSWGATAIIAKPEDIWNLI